MSVPRATRPRMLAIAALTAIILAAPAASTRAHEFEPGDDQGGAAITVQPLWPTGVGTQVPVSVQPGDDHGLLGEVGDDHGQDG